VFMVLLLSWLLARVAREVPRAASLPLFSGGRRDSTDHRSVFFPGCEGACPETRTYRLPDMSVGRLPRCMGSAERQSAFLLGADPCGRARPRLPTHGMRQAQRQRNVVRQDRIRTEAQELLQLRGIVDRPDGDAIEMATVPCREHSLEVRSEAAPRTS